MADPLADLLDLFSGPEADAFYDESVTELEHALQCGALAEAAGADDALVVAALLHDVGHLVVHDLVDIDAELTNDHHHERAGAHLLNRWFGAAVTEPVRLHVAAKRYLCATDPSYHERLSASSIRSLGVQGGPMDPADVHAFEHRAHHRDAVQVRQWDDEAKVQGLEVAPLGHYLPVLQALVR